MLSGNVEADLTIVAVLELEVEAHAVEGEAGAGGFGIDAYDSGFTLGCFTSEDEGGFGTFWETIRSEE